MKHKALITAGWDDVPHLSAEQKERLLAGYTLPHQIKARTKGIPSLGSGAIFPLDEDEIKCDPIKIPPWYAKVCGLDVGWNKTAAIWGAHDRETDIVYLYSEHYRGQAEPPVHASAIKARGAWMKCVIDTASRGRSQTDGTRLYQLYGKEGLRLQNAEKSVEAGLLAVWTRLSTGRLKVFSTLENFFAEYRMYQRDENGKIMKRADHLMDATRYLIMGLRFAECEPAPESDFPQRRIVGSSAAGY